MQVTYAQSTVTVCRGTVRSPQVLVKSSWHLGVDEGWRNEGWLRTTVWVTLTKSMLATP